MTDYPVGARWEAIDSTGAKATVWLDAATRRTETWRWSFAFYDGSGLKDA